MARLNITSGAPWEDKVGYCRAVKIGNVIEVAGTTAVKDGQVCHEGNAFEQTKVILGIIEEALIKAGAKLTDVVRTRIYITRISDFNEVGRAHGLFFSDIKPASTLVEISALVDPKMLVEIEATAILQ